jgi:hypothetical protein
MGCGWNDRDAHTLEAVDAVEIVNGDAAEDPPAGWRFWTDLLNRGHRLTAIGGSDEHTPDETADRRIGRPTTMIRAEELSEAALIAGLRAGRAYVRMREPAGPSIQFLAVTDGMVAQMGDTVAPATLTLNVETERARGQRLSWIRRGVEIGSATIGRDGRASTTVEAGDGDWFSVVIRDAHGPTLLSNPIYVASAR